MCTKRIGLFWIALASVVPSVCAGNSIELPFLPGEKLTYSVRVWLGTNQLGLDVGTAVLSVDKIEINDTDPLQFRLVARGGALGYRVDSILTSLINSDTLLAIRYYENHKGSEKKQRRLEFTENSVTYWKYARVELADGTKTDDWDWERRRENKVDRPSYDMLSALYLARGFDLTAGAKPGTIDVADRKKLWRLSAIGKEPEKITVQAGTFSVIPVTFTTKPLNEDASKSKFSGLFGMKGSIKIWVDSNTHRIVRIRGTIPLGIELKVDLSLSEIVSADQ